MDLIGTENGSRHSDSRGEHARSNEETRDEATREKTVVLPGGDARVVDAAAELGRLLDATGRYYYRGGAVCRLRADTLEPLKAAALPSAFESVAKLLVVKGETRVPAICSEAKAKLILNSDEFTRELPPINVVTSSPVLIERGDTLLEITNYDRESGVMAGGWTSDEIDLSEARSLFQNLLGDFNFATRSDQSRAAASFITPALVFGGLLGGRPPIDIGEADASQAGKGYRVKLIAAVYGKRPKTVTQTKGHGVGGLEESFDTALIKGASFISLDNVRGKIDSSKIESFLTEDEYLARTPYAPPMEIDPGRVVLALTSNQAEITRDLANRASCVRILKQPDSHEFTAYPDGDLLDHVVENRQRYLGAVFALVREWHRLGKPRTNEGRHDFRPWARRLDWIVQNLLGMPPLLDGHRETQERMTTPALTWLRQVAILVRQADRLDAPLRAHDILDILEDAEETIPGLKDDDDLTEDDVRSKVMLNVGRKLGTCFRGGRTQVVVDAFTVSREGVDGDNRHKSWAYTFRVETDELRSCAPIAPMETEDKCSQGDSDNNSYTSLAQWAQSAQEEEVGEI